MLYILNYMVYALQLLQLTTFWVICVTVNIKKCPVLARMQAWIRLHQWLCNGIVHSSPHRQSDAASNRSHPALLSGNSLLQYAADVVNWIQVMAVQRPQIWGDERMVVGFTQLFLIWCLFRHFRPRSRYMICTIGDWERPVSLDIWCVAGGFIVSAPTHSTTATFSSMSMCNLACDCHAFSQYFMFLTAYSVMYLVLPLSTFIPGNLAVVCMNMHYAAWNCSKKVSF